MYLFLHIIINLSYNNGKYFWNRYLEKKKINFFLKKINKYIDTAKKHILIRGFHKSYSKPKITVLITSYNSEKYIAHAIRSVQNQRMEDIEILVIDDNSRDNTLKIIDNIRIKDKRIKVIRNNKNKGALYSKSLGILKAKGKYIMLLDGDDFFINEDLFNICFFESIKSNIDIIEFSGLFLEKEKFELNGKFPKIPLYFRYKKDKDFIKQPQLSRFLYRSLDDNKYKLIDGFLTGKCIKTNILQKTIKAVGKKIYTQKLNYGDDRLINYLLFKKANSFKFIKKYGYIYNYNNASITHINKTFNNCHDELINIAHIYKYSQFTNESEIASYELFHRFKNIIKPGLNNKNLKYLNELIKIMIKNKYISNYNKIKLINILNI